MVLLLSVSRSAKVGAKGFHSLLEPAVEKLLSSEMSNVTGWPISVEVRSRDASAYETVLNIAICGPHMLVVKVGLDPCLILIEESKEVQ